MVWNKDYPTSTVSPSASTLGLTGNWKALEDWWGVEHTTLTSASSGHHTAQNISLVCVAATSAISALSSPGTGALAYDTTKGELEVYRTAGWGKLTESYWSRVRTVFLSASISTATWTKLTEKRTVEEDQYDTLSEFASSSGSASIKATGTYFVLGTCRFPTTSNNYLVGVAIYKNGSAVAVHRGYGAGVRSTEVFDILSLTAGDRLEVYCYHNAGSNITIVGGSLQFTKLS